ncbi:MAG: hypothetical protein LIO77_10900, partial [Rikenellaceae bacterium]|nr:hypothetical protein [Rikenellaceae bacterium]
MDKKEELRRRIYGLEDDIRRAPQGTPNKVIFDWYTRIDDLRGQLKDLEDGTPEITTDESNNTAHSNADTEAMADDAERGDFIRQWNEDESEPQSWSQ